MDIEKLIRRLRNDADAYRNGKTLGRAFADQEDVLDNAATALSTLQAENEKLRAELEQIPSCIYYKQGGLCRYGGDDPANVCVLGPCDHDVSVQDVLTELEQVKAERDAAIDCINQIQSARDHTRPAYVVDSILHNWKSRK